MRVLCVYVYVCLLLFETHVHTLSHMRVHFYLLFSLFVLKLSQKCPWVCVDAHNHAPFSCGGGGVGVASNQLEISPRQPLLPQCLSQGAILQGLVAILKPGVQG